MAVPVVRFADFGRDRLSRDEAMSRWPVLQAVAIWSGVSVVMWLMIFAAVGALQESGGVLN